jgi:hypothetical protein
MIRTIVAIFFLALFLMPSVLYAESDPGELYVHLVEGDIQMRMSDASDWVPTAGNTPLFEGDSLWVPYDARGDIRFRNGTSARIGANTAVTVGHVEAGNYEVYLDGGHMYVNYRGAAGSSLAVYARDTSFRLDAAGIFRVDVPENGDTEISVFSGALYVNRGNGEMRIGKGERVVMKDRGYSPALTSLAYEDEWGRWNRQRDQDAYGRGTASAQYLPGELAGYSSDLENSGRWLNTPDYGYVWTPVITSAEWSPYRVGRWVWMRGDYVWISLESWGWVPYHYGRWTFVSRVGWCWVPPARGDVFWAPGYVAWVQTPTYVAWVPLAPREVYYGRGYHGPHSFDIGRSAPPRASAPIIYRNTHVLNGVTTVNRDAFLSGRPVETRVRENPFSKERPLFGAPQITPSRASAMPAIKDIPRGKEPPEKFRQLEVNRSRMNGDRRGPDRGGPSVLPGSGRPSVLPPGPPAVGPAASPGPPRDGVTRYGNREVGMPPGDRDQAGRPGNRPDAQQPARQPGVGAPAANLPGSPKPIVAPTGQSPAPMSQGQENRRPVAEPGVREKTIRPGIVGQPKPIEVPSPITPKQQGPAVVSPPARQGPPQPVSAPPLDRSAVQQAPPVRSPVPSVVQPPTPRIDAPSSANRSPSIRPVERVPTDRGEAVDAVREHREPVQGRPETLRKQGREEEEKGSPAGRANSRGQSQKEKEGDARADKDDSPASNRERPGNVPNPRPQFDRR